MSLYTYHLSCVIAGSNGSAASTAIDGSVAFADNVSKRPLSGRIAKIDVVYNTQPNTTDVVVKTLGKNGPAQTYLTLTNKNTDGTFYPLTAAHDTSGVAVTYDGTHGILTMPIVDDQVAVTVAQGNAGTIDVYVTVECD